MKKIVSLVGARSQFVKEAVVGAEVQRRNARRHVLVRGNSNITVARFFASACCFVCTFKNRQSVDAIMLKHA